jgi:hypothetical protein
MKTCEICNKKHKKYDDVYEWYGHYLDFNPKNTDVEIWDIKKKKWFKQDPVLTKSKNQLG